MVLNTRNFALYLLAVAILIITITVTVVGNQAGQGNTASVIDFAAPVTAELNYTAEVVETPTMDRGARADLLRQKIALADSLDEVVESPVSATEPPPPPDDVVPVAPAKPKETILCPGYSEVTPVWSTTDIEFAVVEGARLVFRDKEVEEVVVTASSSETVSSIKREVLLQLPLRTLPLTVKSCLPNDIVGIALDGSLIRNDEQTMYAIFGSETLIGYALDGFPLYGNNEEVVEDECGGVFENGQYRYYLSAGRETILGCFSGIPISI